MSVYMFAVYIFSHQEKLSPDIQGICRQGLEHFRDSKASTLFLHLKWETASLLTSRNVYLAPTVVKALSQF